MVGIPSTPDSVRDVLQVNGNALSLIHPPLYLSPLGKAPSVDLGSFWHGSCRRCKAFFTSNLTEEDELRMVLKRTCKVARNRSWAAISVQWRPTKEHPDAEIHPGRKSEAKESAGALHRAQNEAINMLMCVTLESCGYASTTTPL